MTKEFYDSILNTMKGNVSYEELNARYTAMNLIESADRAAADGILAGVTSADFCQLFMIFGELKEKHSYKKTAELYELLEKCENHWHNIQNTLTDMSNPARSNDAKKKVWDAVKKATKPTDIIDI